jgi:hypothetical protein
MTKKKAKLVISDIYNTSSFTLFWCRFSLSMKRGHRKILIDENVIPN